MQSGSIQIRVSDLLFALNKRWKLILALTIVGGVFGMMLFALTYVQDSYRSYEVSGSFAISTQKDADDGVYINGSQIANNNDYHLAEDMADAVIYVVRSNAVLNNVIQQQNLLGSTVDELRSNLTLNQYQSTQILEMHFTWRTAEEAVTIWQAIVDQANAILPNALQLGQLAVINPPEIVQSSSAGSGKIFPFILAFLGFGSGVGFALIELILRPTLTNPRDAETLYGLETIGIIPQDTAYFRSRQGSILTATGTDRSNVVQNYSAAAYILRNRLGTKEQHHCFYVTSATTGEGKSTVAANLALQLSDMEHRTLLVDFDIRNPSLGTLFMDKVDYAHSLNALYRGEATEEDAITTLTGYLDLLPAVLEHNTISMDGAVTDLIERLREKYEYIILDSAPVGEVSETLSLNRVANTVLFVIGYDSTPLPAIQSALEKLDKSGIRVLGCVVNGVGNGQKDGEEKRRRAPAAAPKRTRKTKTKTKTKAKSKDKKRRGASNPMPAAAPAAVEAPGWQGVMTEQPKPEPAVQSAPPKAPVEVPVEASKPPKPEQPAKAPKEPKRTGLFGGGKKERTAAKHGKHAKGVSLPPVEPKVEAEPAAPVSRPVQPITRNAAPAAPVRPATSVLEAVPAAPKTAKTSVLEQTAPEIRRPVGPPPVETMSLHRRDVLSELMGSDPVGEERTDSSVMEELLRLGREKNGR